MDDDDEFPLCLRHLAEGQTVKAKRNGEFARADVIDLVECRIEDEKPNDSNVKVHWWGTKPAEDKWIRVEDVRLIKQFSVDWKDIKLLLPIAHDPESRKTRKEVYTKWSTEGKKSLSLKELQAGVKAMFSSEIGEDLEELTKAVEYAHKVARTLSPSKKGGGAKRVDFTEFHGFVHALRYYLELAELFEHLDSTQEDDQKLSLREARKGLAQLQEWGIDNAMLEKEFKFDGIDCWTPKLKFADFAKFCVESRWSKMELELELDSSDSEVEEEEGKFVLLDKAGIDVKSFRRKSHDKELTDERKKIIAAFKQWDSDGSGKITEEELAQVLITLNDEKKDSIEPDKKDEFQLDQEAVATIFKAADANTDGFIDIEEFCLWLFSRDEL